MGGAVTGPGNATPVAEFNTMADAPAAARVFALTSPNPATTMPPSPPPGSLKVTDGGGPQPTILPPYPQLESLGPTRLDLILFSLDITEQHTLRRDEFTAKTHPLVENGSPLAEWTTAFLTTMFRTMETLLHGHGGGATSLSLHDPLCVWYALTAEHPPPDDDDEKEDEKQGGKWQITALEDIRVETAGQWTKGMCVIDRRRRKRAEDGEGGVVGDLGGWLDRAGGNRVRRCVGTPGTRALAGVLLNRVFG